MAEAIGIAAGVLQLLQTTWTVAYELKKFHSDVALVGKTIADLKHDVEGLVRVLESMRDAFENITAEHGSGHMGSLWTNVAKSIEDGNAVLRQIQDQVQEINRETKFLDDARKQLRLNRAEPKLARFRDQIQSYKDGLQLSLQAIMLWNQMSYQKTANQVLPNLSDLHDDVRRIAVDLNQRIEALQAIVSSQQEEAQVVAMQNLRECVRSAASTISSATTIVAARQPSDQTLPSSSSDFGDVFPVQYSIAMQRWVESNTVYEYNESASRAPPQSVADVPILNDSEDNSSDSDVELEAEMTRLLLDTGKQKLAAGDNKGGERMLRNCLRRLDSPHAKRATKEANLQLDVVLVLHDFYFTQEKWSEAQNMLLQKMAIQERLLGKNDPGLLQDIISLSKLQIQKGDFVAAQVHARRALKGYKKLQKPDETIACLSLLIEICSSDGSEGDKEAYTLMLMRLKNDEGGAPVSLSSEQTLNASTETLPDRTTGGADLSDYHDTITASTIADAMSLPATSDVTAKLSLSADAGVEEAKILMAPEIEEKAAPFHKDEEDALQQSEDDQGVQSGSSSTKNGAEEVEMEPTSSLITREALSAKDEAEKTNKTKAELPMVVEPVNARRYNFSNAKRFSFTLAETSEEQASSLVSVHRSTRSRAADLETVATIDSHEEPAPSNYLTKALSASDLRQSVPASSPPSIDPPGPSQSSNLLTLPLENVTTGAIQPDIKQDDFEREYSKQNRDKIGSWLPSLHQPLLSDTTFTAANDLPLQRSVSSSAIVGPPPPYAAVSANYPRYKYPRYKALYAFVGQTNAELNLKKDEIIRVMQKRTNGWWLAERFDQSACGWVPAEYLEEVLSSAKSVVRSDALRPARSISVSKPRAGLSSPRVKVVVVGDTAIGKTALINALSNKPIPDKSAPPTTIHNDVTWVNVDGQTVELAIWDNPGIFDFRDMRVQSYSNAHVILICFAIDHPDSLDNVEEFWGPEASKFGKNVPLFLVGTRADLRDDPRIQQDLLKTSQHTVSSSEGYGCRRIIGAQEYHECSAINNQGVAELFEAATRAALATKAVKAQGKKKGIFSSLRFSSAKARS